MKQNAAGIFVVLAAVASGRACVTWLFSEKLACRMTLFAYVAAEIDFRPQSDFRPKCAGCCS